MTSAPDMLRAALWYARRGLHVIPTVGGIGPRSKHPVTARGCHDASIDAKQIRAWWPPGSRRNIALVAGPNNLVIVDVDGDAGRASLAEREREYGFMPVTTTATTGRNEGGAHLYFRAPAVRIASKAHALGEGLDTRAHWAYVIAPPSVHESGRTYRWAPGRAVHEIPIAPLPLWIIAALAPPSEERSTVPVELASGDATRYASAALSAECAAVTNAPEGTRNDTLNAAAFSVGTLVGAGALNVALARGALIEAGRRAGLSARESLKTVNGGISAGMAQPRRLSA